MKQIVVLATVALALASCTAAESSTPGIDADSPTSELDGASSAQPAPTLAEPAPSATPTSLEPTEPDSTSPDPPPTEAPLDLVATACESLQNDGYETRQTTLASMDEATLAGIEIDCPAELAQLVGASEIEDRMATFNASADGLTATALVCDAGDFSLDITNNVDHPLGIHGSLRLQAEGDPDPIGSTLEPLVIWQLDAGATTTLAGNYRLTRESDAPLTCEVDLTAFDASPTDADASLGGTPRQPELSGDDPALWLPALVAQGAALPGSNLPDAAAAVEDVRSSEYARVLESVTAEVDQLPPSVTISVCSASIDQPDERTISLVYFAQPTDPDTGIDSVLQHGLFRRGNDSQWRWLTNSKYFDSRDYWNCGTPTVDL